MDLNTDPPTYIGPACPDLGLYVPDDPLGRILWPHLAGSTYWASGPSWECNGGLAERAHLVRVGGRPWPPDPTGSEPRNQNWEEWNANGGSWSASPPPTLDPPLPEDSDDGSSVSLLVGGAVLAWALLR